MDETPGYLKNYRDYARIYILLALAGCIGFTVMIFAYVPGFLAPRTPHAEPIVLGDEIEAPTENPFSKISIEAGAAIVYDVNRKSILYGKNTNVQLPLASLTKLMTVLVATEYLSSENMVAIGASANLDDFNTVFNEGDRWKFKDLVDLTLVISSNRGAQALANAASGAFQAKNSIESGTLLMPKTFTESMNDKARELGLSQTYYLNPTGLDTNAEVAGGVGSAYDTALLLSYLIEHVPHTIEVTRYPSVTVATPEDAHFRAQNTNADIGIIPGLIASKTGYTNLAGGNLAIAFDAGIGHPVIVVVLASTQSGRFSDVRKLIEASLACLESDCAALPTETDNSVS